MGACSSAPEKKAKAHVTRLNSSAWREHLQESVPLGKDSNGSRGSNPLLSLKLSCCFLGRKYPGVRLPTLLKLRERANQLQKTQGPPRTWLKAAPPRAAGEPLTTEDVLHEIIMQSSAPRKCAYHTMLPRAEVGVASVHVCHSRADLFSDLVDALAAAGFASDRAYAIDVLTISPWRGALDDYGVRAAEMASRMRACEYFVLVLPRWQRPSVLRDLWVQFELRAASLGECEVQVRMPPTQTESFELALVSNLGGLHDLLVNRRGAPELVAPDVVDAISAHAAPSEVRERAVVTIRAWLAERAMEMLDKRRGDEPLMRAIARLQRLRGADDGEELLLRMLVRVSEERHGANGEQTLRAVSELGRMLASAGKLEPASHMYRRALEAYEQKKGWSHPDTLATALHLAQLSMARGLLAEAEALFAHAEMGYTFGKGVAGKHERRLLATLHGQGVLLHKQEEWDLAEEKLRRALAGRQTLLGQKHPESLSSAIQLAHVLEETNQHEEATAMYVLASKGRMSYALQRQSSFASSMDSGGGDDEEEGGLLAQLERNMLVERATERNARARRFSLQLQARRNYPAQLQGPVRHRVKRLRVPKQKPKPDTADSAPGVTSPAASLPLH